MPLACFGANSNLSARWKHAKGMSLRYGVIVLRNLMRLFTKKSCYHQGFFAVKRRAVFILGEKWKAVFFVFGHALGLSKAGGMKKVWRIALYEPPHPQSHVIL